MSTEKNPTVILPIYWNTNPEFDKSFTDGLKIFYDRLTYKASEQELHLFGEDIDKLLGEAASAKEYNWAVIFAYGNIFASQLKVVQEIKNFIASLKEEVLVCGHLMNKPGFYCGLHEQCFIVNLDVYRRLKQPSFGPYQKSQKKLRNYEAGPSFHDNYTPEFLRPVAGYGEYTTKVNGWAFVNASLEAGLPIFNFPKTLREAKVFMYPDDETEKLNKNLNLLHQWEDLANFTQRAAFAHLMLKKLGVASGTNKGSFGFRERTNCLFFFNSQLLLPDPSWLARGEGPIDQYTGPCSGFQDLAFMKTYGFHPQTELVYFDINPLALEMKEFIFQNFDGQAETIETLIDALRLKYPDEEIYTGSIYAKMKALLSVFGNSEKDLFETWQKFRQLKRSYIHLNLLQQSEKVFERLDQSKQIIFNVTDIYLGQNELLYGYKGISDKFNALQTRAAEFSKLMLTGTSVNQVIFLEYAHKIKSEEI